MVVKVRSRYFRPAEVEILLGNPAKAKKLMGLEPKIKFDEFICIMTDADWELLKK